MIGRREVWPRLGIRANRQQAGRCDRHRPGQEHHLRKERRSSYEEAARPREASELPIQRSTTETGETGPTRTLIAWHGREISESTKTSIQQRARERWPQISDLRVRHHGVFTYVHAVLDHDGEPLALCRIRYNGSAHDWHFAIYRASHGDYEESFFPTVVTHRACSLFGAVDGGRVGFYVQKKLTNKVACNNKEDGAKQGLTNIPCSA